MIAIFNENFESEEELKSWFDEIVSKHDNFWTVLNFREIANCCSRGEVSKRIFDQITKENKLEAFIDDGRPITKKDIGRFEKCDGGRLTEKEFDDYLTKKYLEKLELCYCSLLKKARGVFGDVRLYSLPVLQKMKQKDVQKYIQLIECEYEEVKNVYILAEVLSAKSQKDESRRFLGNLQDGLDYLKNRSSLRFDEMMDLLGYCSGMAPETKLLRLIFDPFESLSRHLGITCADNKNDCEAIGLVEFKNRLAKLQDEVGNKK